jgi:hypothetical protein
LISSSINECEDLEKSKVEANGIQLDANNPCEDRLVAKHLDNLKSGFFIGVFDGHLGW